jgi:hypothetical protein
MEKRILFAKRINWLFHVFYNLKYFKGKTEFYRLRAWLMISHFYQSESFIEIISIDQKYLV